MQACYTEVILISEQNVEIVRRAIDAFTERDLDAALRDLDPDAIVDWSRSRGLEAGIYRGHTAIRDFWKTFLDVFAEIEVSDIEFIASGEHVVAPNRIRARGRDGIEVDARYVAVVRLRSGRIVEWQLFPDKEEALKAAGLAD
jgi:ketosteroid isomerase-like protein